MTHRPDFSLLATVDVLDTEQFPGVLAGIVKVEGVSAAGFSIGLPPEDSIDGRAGVVVGWEPLAAPLGRVASSIAAALGEKPRWRLVKLHTNIILQMKIKENV